MKSLIFRKGSILLDNYGNLPAGDAMPVSVDEPSVFRFRDYVARNAVSDEVPEGWRWVGLRDSCRILSADDYKAASKGSELLFWDRTTRFCPTCGNPLHRASEISKVCENCGREIFPSVSPCVIVLVRRGEEALLVRNASFRGNFYGLVAGFVETGETLEECVVREVREETSLEVKDIRYFGSQDWPYPSQLMVAFTAEYASGEVKFADGELCAGGFYSRDNHPEIPPPPSIGRRLIESWLYEKR